MSCARPHEIRDRLLEVDLGVARQRQRVRSEGRSSRTHPGSSGLDTSIGASGAELRETDALARSRRARGARTRLPLVAPVLRRASRIWAREKLWT